MDIQSHKMLMDVVEKQSDKIFASMDALRKEMEMCTPEERARRKDEFDRRFVALMKEQRDVGLKLINGKVALGKPGHA
jgi:hypothetical protein